jgi:hypothetical protein
MAVLRAQFILYIIKCKSTYLEIMSNHNRFRKIVSVYIVTILLATFFLVIGNTLQSTDAQSGLPHKLPCSDIIKPGVAKCHIVSQNLGVPMTTSGNDLYMAWPNNDTGHWNVFFAKSTDGGKTLKTMMISAPNKGTTIDQNTEIAASGSNVYVTWWTNKTGVLMPLFRASNDGGNTFAKPIMLNSTG